MDSFDTVTNERLIGDNLDHLLHEAANSSPFYFRIGKEAHQLFFRAMIALLRGSNDLSISQEHTPKSRDHAEIYSRDGVLWFRVQKDKDNLPKGCNKAWRFTEPSSCDAPPESPPLSFQEHAAQLTKAHQQNLIGFYTALAMIQAPHCMEQYVFQHAVTISDHEMSLLEWLHEEVRNEHEHFKPKLYSVDKTSTILASRTCVEKSRELLGMHFWGDSDQREFMLAKLEAALCLLPSSDDALATAPDSTPSEMPNES